jgi:hypothetical protein
MFVLENLGREEAQEDAQRSPLIRRICSIGSLGG